MWSFRVSAIIGAMLSAALASGGDVEGKVVINRKLTKRKVTGPAGAYERGSAVDLGSKGVDDGLAFERMHVAVYLEGPLSSKPVTATLEQKNRQFVPDFLVIAAGSEVSFPNLDPIFHNVFSLSKPKAFDLGNYPRNQTRVVSFPRPGIVFVNCHLHPNMSAAIVITPNQWNAIPDAAGHFVLADVPKGAYTIVAWHKSAGFFRQKVELGEGRDRTVEFVIPVDENGVVVSQR